MKYKVLDEKVFDCGTNGTSLKGFVTATYDKLLKKLGEPTSTEDIDEKVQCEWVIQFDDGQVATVYNWKTGGVPLYEYEWHIGGHESSVVRLVKDIIE